MAQQPRHAPQASAATSKDQPAGTDRRTRSRQKRRDEVYAAAVELFIEQGFESTTMEQIADRADVARATVFNHYPRKTAFLDEWTLRRRSRAAAATMDIEEGSLDGQLHHYMTEMARISEESREETRALLSAALQQTNFLAHPMLADELAEIVRGARRNGFAPDDVHAGQVGLMLATSYFAVLNQWIATEPPDLDLERELLIVVNIILYGVYSPRKPLDNDPSLNGSSASHTSTKKAPAKKR